MILVEETVLYVLRIRGIMSMGVTMERSLSQSIGKATTGRHSRIRLRKTWESARNALSVLRPHGRTRTVESII